MFFIKLIRNLIYIFAILLIIFPIVIQDKIYKENRSFDGKKNYLISRRDELQNFTKNMIEKVLADTAARENYYAAIYFLDLNSFYKNNYRIEINFKLNNFKHSNPSIEELKNSFIDELKLNYLKIDKLRLSSIVFRFIHNMNKKNEYYEYNYSVVPDSNKIVLTLEIKEN